MKKQIDGIENEKRDFIVGCIENTIEKNNRYIQVFLLLFAIIAGVVYGFIPDEKVQAIVRYTLVLNMIMEMYVLQVKDCIMHRKLNMLSIDVRTKSGGLRFESDINIDNFFENVDNDLFISGIAPSRFLQKYQTKMEQLLEENVKVKVQSKWR